jgi:hypothetical protein
MRCQGPGKKNKVVPETLKFDEEARTHSFGRCTEISIMVIPINIFMYIYIYR